MPINLLGYAAPQNATSLASSSQKNQTTTPLAVPQKLPNNTARTVLGGTPGAIGQPMGITAKSPYSNQSAPSGQLPKTQVDTSKPVVPSTPSVPSSPPAGQAGTAGSVGNQYTQDASGKWVLGGGSTTPAPQGQNAGYQYDASGNIKSDSNAVAGTAGSADPTANTGALGAAANGAPTATPYSASNPPYSQAGLLGAALGQAQKYYDANQGLTQKSQDIASKFANQEGDLVTGYNGLGGAETNSRLQQLEQFKNSAIGAVESEQGKQAAYASPLFSAYGTGINALSPQTQFGQLTNPFTGEVISPAGGNPQLNTAVVQTVQLIRNGTNSQDAIAQTGLSAFGLLGSQLLTSALQQGTGGTYNPTAQNAIANQNVSQGAQYQGQAQEISNALQTLAPVQQAIVPYMSANNLDSNGVPFANQQINKINAQANPAAYATMQAAISEARSYAIQLLGSQSGANPTDVTNSVNSFDFGSFKPDQLNTFLNNLASLGQYRLSQAQSASQSGYGGAQGAAQGITATPGTPLQSGGSNDLNNLPDGVKLILGSAGSVTSGILNKLGEVGTDAAAGGIAGAAASLFK